MNPLLITAAAGAKKVFSNKYVLIAIIAIISIWLIKGGISKAIRYFKEKSFDKNEAKDVNQIAQQYRAASNPSGTSWMIDWDGTSEDQIEKLAYQTKGHLESVARVYKQKFDETLTDRMRKELDTDDFQNWHNIVT
jgi:ABC-type Na+ efflux pump permease subunit